MPQPVTLKKLKLTALRRPTRPLTDEDLQELRPKKDVLFIIGHWNAKAGSQETPGVTGKFGLGIRTKQGKD